MFACLCVLAPFACEGKGGDARGESAAESSAREAPPLVGKTIDGEAFDLVALRGQVVLVNVWATWCEPCREELPELQRLHGRHAARGFTVVGVSIDRRSALRAVRQMAADFGLSYAMVFDPESEAIAPWKVVGYPTSFLVDRGGAVVWRRDGIVKPDDAELGAYLDAALAAAP